MGIETNVIMENSCLSCEKAGEWAWALQGLRRLKTLSMEPEASSMSPVISAIQSWKLVLVIVTLASQLNILDTILLNSAIDAFGAAWHWAGVYLASPSLSPDKASFSAAMTVYTGAGKWTSTLALLQRICSSGKADFISTLAFDSFDHRVGFSRNILQPLLLKPCCVTHVGAILFSQKDRLQRKS